VEDSEIERIGLIVMRQAELVGAELSKDAPDVPRLLGRRPRMSSEPASVTLQ
jgi:hypothetical protein